MIIPTSNLVKAAQAISKMNEKKLADFFRDFEKKQEVLYSYIIANADNMKNEDAREDFTYVFSVIWKTYDSLKGGTKTITTKELEKKEQEHIKGWETFSSITNPKEEEAFVKAFINQPEIWDFMIDIIFPDPDKPDQTNFTEKDIAIAFACVNLMTAVLNDAASITTGKKEVSKKPAAKKPAAKKPAAKKPAAKKPAAKKPVAKKPTAKKPVAKKPTAKKPVAKKPVAKKPAAKKPVAKKPVAKKPAAKKPVAKKAVTKKPAAKKPVAKKPAAKKPVAKKPAVKKSK